ncbi:MAG: hypothetical protein MUE73_06385 [Planctomycetes bacterium]|jgi:hypothetical protein|nr:hypothetical protein [Planctomycetota bacterium]
MARLKMVYISADAHRRLKILAARRNVPMRKLVEDLVDREAEDSSNPWLSPEGLRLQQSALAEDWAEPALDVYDDD